MAQARSAWTFIAAIASAFALLSLTAPASAQTSPCTSRAGWVVKIDGSISDVQIRRGPETLVGSPYMALCAGDRVEVAHATVAHLRLNWMADPQVVRSAAAYDVSPPSNANTQIVSNAWEYIRQNLLPDFERMIGHARMRTVSECAVASGAALRYASPGLADGAARVSLADNFNGLTFCWSGGAAPYQLSVRDPAGVEQYRAINIAAHTFAADPLPLSAGRWRVTVSDASGASIDGAFVVSDGAAPSPPGWDARQYDESLRVTWLARCQSREWGFTALQQVASRRAGSVPSSAMYQMLAEYADAQPGC